MSTHIYIYIHTQPILQVSPAPFQQAPSITLYLRETSLLVFCAHIYKQHVFILAMQAECDHNMKAMAQIKQCLLACIKKVDRLYTFQFVVLRKKLCILKFCIATCIDIGSKFTQEQVGSDSTQMSYMANGHIVPL